jgi:hypothetical protein
MQKFYLVLATFNLNSLSLCYRVNSDNCTCTIAHFSGFAVNYVDLRNYSKFLAGLRHIHSEQLIPVQKGLISDYLTIDALVDVGRGGGA